MAKNINTSIFYHICGDVLAPNIIFLFNASALYFLQTFFIDNLCVQ